MTSRTAAVLTISDSAHRGTRADTSGPRVVETLRAAGFAVSATEIVPDERGEIERALIRLTADIPLVITTGGTGIAARDVTPEATFAVCERQLPGVAEVMRSAGARTTPLAALSRGVCGVRGSALILNLPGNPSAAVESLSAVIAILPHALDLLAGNTAH
jgi:molybdenum cofactor synthesis domain-containing protein